MLILNPQDVDIVILTTSYDTERLKAMLVARDPTFYLRSAKTFGATYKVLWARIGYSYAQSDACKVDILTPGVMNIPDVPREHIVTIDRFPVMPMIPLLLLKLQAWMDHRAATKPYLHDKQYQDVQDIRELLTIAARRADNIKEASWVPSEFMAAAKPRIEEFRALISRDREPWKAIGYKFTETKSKPKASEGKASVVASGFVIFLFRCTHPI